MVDGRTFFYGSGPSLTVLELSDSVSTLAKGFGTPHMRPLTPQAILRPVGSIMPLNIARDKFCQQLMTCEPSGGFS